LKIAAGVTSEAELEREKSKTDLTDLSDLWAVCPNSKKDFWFLRPGI